MPIELCDFMSCVRFYCECSLWGWNNFTHKLAGFPGNHRDQPLRTQTPLMTPAMITITNASTVWQTFPTMLMWSLNGMDPVVWRNGPQQAGRNPRPICQFTWIRCTMFRSISWDSMHALQFCLQLLISAVLG